LDGTKIAHNFSRARTQASPNQDSGLQEIYQEQLDLQRNVGAHLSKLPEGWFGKDVEK